MKKKLWKRFFFKLGWLVAIFLVVDIYKQVLKIKKSSHVYTKQACQIKKKYDKTFRMFVLNIIPTCKVQFCAWKAKRLHTDNSVFLLLFLWKWSLNAKNFYIHWFFSYTQLLSALPATSYIKQPQESFKTFFYVTHWRFH